MTNINPINFGISGNQYFKNEEKEDLKQKRETNTTAQAESGKKMESNAVLGYMAAQNADIIPTKTTKSVDVSKYVSDEDAQRIEDFIANFEADYDEAAAIAMDEFPDLSEEAAGSIALAYINSSY